MTANKIKGDFEIVAGDTTYTARFGMNALAKIEEEFGKSVESVFADIEKQKSIRATRTLIRCAIQTHHPEVTDEDVGNIMDAVGLDKLSDLMAEGVKAAFPDAVKGAKAGADAHPTAGAKPAGGTGQG